MKKTFKSRVSVLLLTFLSAVSLPMIIFVISQAVRNNDMSGLFPFFVASLVIISIFGFRYIIMDEKLCSKWWGIPCGSILISEIHSVKSTYNPLSSPAASLKRLAIYDEKGRLVKLISPAHEQEFLKTLKTINPSIQIQVTDQKGGLRFWEWDI